MPWGLFSPEMSEAFTVAPEVVYSPTVYQLTVVRDKKIRPRYCDAEGAI